MQSLVKRRINIWPVLAFIVFVLVSVAMYTYTYAANTFPGQYKLVTVNNTNGLGVDRSAKVLKVDNDGKRVFFSSSATNLPQSSATASAQTWAGYVHDVSTGATARFDLSTNGTIPDKSISNYAISSTGRYVAFTTNATNMIDGTTMDNSVSRVYLKDIQTNMVDIIVNIPHSIVNGVGTGSSPVSVSDDGRYIGIVTNRVNSLLPGTRLGNGGGYRDLVLYDRVKETWTLINQSIDGIMQSASVGEAEASCDGAVMIFMSTATNLTSAHQGGGKHIFLADIRNGVSITDITPAATGENVWPYISCNGRFITYGTKDRVVIPSPAGVDARFHIARYDRITEDRRYVDSGSDNTSYGSGLEYDYMAQSSVSDAGDVLLPVNTAFALGSTRTKIMLKHLSDGSGTLESVANTYAGLEYPSSYRAVIAPDGKYIAVSSNEGYTVGVLPGFVSTSAPLDVIRIKTGL